MFPEINLQDQVAIVTGAGRGIGRAIALVLSEAGADLVVVSRSQTEIDSLVGEIEKTGRRALAIAADLTDSRQVDGFVEQALNHYGKIDILVNNAGQFQKCPIVPLPDVDLRPPIVPKAVTSRMSDEDWLNIFAVNVHGMFYCCRAVAPSMLARNQGVVINVSSNSAIQASPYVAAYNASKASVNMLTKVLALEWANYNIRVNAIAPGEYHTSLTDFSWSDETEKAKRLARIPLHREGSLRELGLLVTYLASPAASYMTGQIIGVDGGLTAR
ncbi:SDR family NAD(P)-dependent oxidoreductase [Calothrix rhizosoleniae]|uniref:SDR family NAD(P)-dependent oxidoreductase n=1 Tax=Calothrix rhizosoleniae TaxID=888997 RepID=UPI000B4A2F15|nr:SDR family NAD(P)-dependent oxidoreductase [Calothrix rhizosoleniae]